MKCESEGKILQELGRRVGKTRDGREWESIDYLLQEDNDIYHYHLRFTMTSFDGPVIDAPRLGDRVRVWFTVRATQWQGKWINSVNAHRVERII